MKLQIYVSATLLPSSVVMLSVLYSNLSPDSTLFGEKKLFCSPKGRCVLLHPSNLWKSYIESCPILGPYSLRFFSKHWQVTWTLLSLRKETCFVFDFLAWNSACKTPAIFLFSFVVCGLFFCVCGVGLLLPSRFFSFCCVFFSFSLRF